MRFCICTKENSWDGVIYDDSHIWHPDAKIVEEKADNIVIYFCPYCHHNWEQKIEEWQKKCHNIERKLKDED